VTVGADRVATMDLTAEGTVTRSADRNLLQAQIEAMLLRAPGIAVTDVRITVGGLEWETTATLSPERDVAPGPGPYVIWRDRLALLDSGAVVPLADAPALTDLNAHSPAVSLDGGESWTWLGAAAVDGASFTYTFPASAGEVRFAFTMPYQEADLQEFLCRHENHPSLRVETLCRTAGGRDTERLRVGRLDGNADHRVLLTARHHCCETMASYVMEGVLATILNDEDDGAWLREHVEFLAVPFMDKDGVEAGDQGKNRKPHDHNRDYIQKIYPSVQALAECVPTWSDGRLRIALDLHCPWIRGPNNEVIYFVGGPDADIWKRVSRFAELLEELRQGPLVYRTADNLPFGKAWNTGMAAPNLKSFGLWAAELPGIEVAGTIETAYANASGSEVNADTARAFGRDLARAIRAYLDRGRRSDSGG